MTEDVEENVRRVRAVRAAFHATGPRRSRPMEGDFERAIALARLWADEFTADAAFVDGSHRFHEVFVDLYFLRKLVRPRGLIVLDDAAWPSVATAVRYFDLNLGLRHVAVGGRLTARQIPEQLLEPDFTDFKPFDRSTSELRALTR